MRTLHTDEIAKTVARLCLNANINLPCDVRRALQDANEKDERSRSVLRTICENFEYAAAEQIPICQDTGMAVVFLELGQDLHINGEDLYDAINAGVAEGYKTLRKSVVADPLLRKNTNNNTPAIIHTEIVSGDKLKITIAPKGFGSENKSSLRMLTPADGEDGVKNFILDTIKKAGGSPCPPIVVGVGVGGTMEKCAFLAKKALLRDIGSQNPDSSWAKREKDWLCEINKLGIGPAGFGGTTTALALNILAHPTHIAGLPVAVNINCHVARHACCVL